MADKEKRWKDHLKEWKEQLKEKEFSHWCWIGILTAAGVLAGQLIGQGDIWRELRYRVYHFETTKLHPTRPLDLHAAFVLVGDDDYWTGGLARRIPIKRDYLASLLRAVDKADAAVVALDFDLRSPTPDGSLIENPDYSCERDELVQAIKEVAENRPVVIPKSLVPAGPDQAGIPKEVSDIFGSDLNGVKNVFPGYIQFAPDLRVIPARLPIDGQQEPMDSFAFAILHAYSPNMYEGFVKEEQEGGKGAEILIRYGSFLNESSFSKLSYSARDVLARNPDVLRRLNHQIVLVGGKWHRDGFGAGEWNDEHLTPAGKMVGVYTHANYAEALRVGRSYPEIPESKVILVEVLLVLGASVALALKVKKVWKIAAIISPSVVMAFVSYFFLQNLGLFFDFFIPMCVLIVHNILDHLEWKKSA